MTWHETHERTRITRLVEAAAAIDQSGKLPWHETWTSVFADEAALLAFLHARWNQMSIAQLSDLTSPDQVEEIASRLSRSNVGVLRILASHGLVGAGAEPIEAA